MMIVNQPDMAKYALACGVDCIFADLESLGKLERQGLRDTWISRHKPEDVSRLREAIGTAPLLVRLNPWHDGSPVEIEDAIARGADLLMLPMFRRLDELVAFCRAVRERVPVIPLVETAESIELLPQVARMAGVTEVYIGLNDLHLSLGLRFMFEPLVNGILDRAADILHGNDMPFGFGGLARVAEGLLPAEMIVGEHVRLGSTAAILSRTFHRQAANLDALRADMDLRLEIDKLRKVIGEFRQADHAALMRNHMAVEKIIEQIVGKAT